MNWKLVTDIILAISLATLAVFIVLGLIQLLQRKSLKKVDKALILAPVPLAFMAITYIVFDKFLIWNTRPNGSGEPSFPSSHVMVVTTIFLIVAIMLPHYLKSKISLTIIYILMLALIIATCIGRVAANMHWTSDVIGALIFSAIFALIYFFLLKHFKPNKK